MKAVAINGSPNMDKGNTQLVLGPFLDGMREAGADVDLFYTTKLTIKPCLGDLACWVKTPGECIQNDDMRMLIPKLITAEVWVLATPVYVDGMTGPMKNLLDRMIPGVLPFFELRDGHCRHPAREVGVKDGKVVVVSSCGFWEMDNFAPLLTHVKAFCKNLGREFAGALLRPHGPVFGVMVKRGMAADDIRDAAKEAGRQLVQDGRMQRETLETVSRTLMPLDMYMEAANRYFQAELDKLSDG